MFSLTYASILNQIKAIQKRYSLIRKQLTWAHVALVKVTWVYSFRERSLACLLSVTAIPTLSPRSAEYNEVGALPALDRRRL